MYHCANKSGEELALKLVAYLMKSESNLLTWNFNRSNQQGVQPSQIPKSTYYFERQIAAEILKRSAKNAVTAFQDDSFWQVCCYVNVMSDSLKRKRGAHP